MVSKAKIVHLLSERKWNKNCGISSDSIGFSEGKEMAFGVRVQARGALQQEALVSYPTQVQEPQLGEGQEPAGALVIAPGTSVILVLLEKRHLLYQLCNGFSEASPLRGGKDML